MNNEGMHCNAMPVFNKGIHSVNANNHYSLITIHYSRQGVLLVY